MVKMVLFLKTSFISSYIIFVDTNNLSIFLLTLHCYNFFIHYIGVTYKGQ